MKSLLEPLRRGLALAVVALLSSCLQLLALDGAQPARAATLPRVIHSHSPEGDPQQSGYTRPRRVDEGKQPYHEAEPMIRIGLTTDAATISLSSPSGLAVRLPTIDIRDSQRISSGRLRAEVRRQRAAPQASAQTKPSHRAQPAISKPGKQATRKADEEEDRRVSRVVAFDADKMIASSETVLIVSPIPGPEADRKSTRLNSSHMPKSRMPSSA